MDFRDIQNLSEAYLGIYEANYGNEILGLSLEEGFVELTPEKQRKVEKNIERLSSKALDQKRQLQSSMDKYYKRKANPVTSSLLGTRGPQQRVAKNRKELLKTKKHLETSMDAVRRSSASRTASALHKRNQVAQKLRDLGADPDASKKARSNIKPFTRNPQNEEYELILNHLLDKGYASSFESAENIANCMSEEWAYEILNEGSLYDMFKAHNDELGASIQRDKERAARIKALSDRAAQFAAPDTGKPASSSEPKRTRQEIISNIKKKLDYAEKVMARQDKTK